MKTLIFLIIILLTIPMAFACNNPTDNFAVEVVLNKPGILSNIGKLGFSSSVIMSGEDYIFQSVYNRNVAAVVTKATDLCLACASVKIQIPVETTTAKIPFVTFTSVISSAKIQNTQEIGFYKTWTINYENPNIELKSGKISINANYASSYYELLIEINEQLPDCSSCNGKCLNSKYGNVCINADMENNIADVLTKVGLITNKEAIFNAYKVIGTGEKTTTDLMPKINTTTIDLRDALKQELDWLSSKSIITISPEDIQQIIQVTESGDSGFNKRIVYSANQTRWLHYYETSSNLTQDINCREFLYSKIPSSLPSSITGYSISNYYFIPIATTLFLAIVLIILIVTARTICTKKSENCEVPAKSKIKFRKD